ncbi:MAG: hypothetical protein K0U47_06945 [Epsilonproteobacteria bacterium]|nr:hypothetical protein [Campylobacterota bacterium]
MKTLLSYAMIFCILILFLLYTTTGNRFLTPFLSSYLTAQLNHKAEVTVTDLSLSLPHFKTDIRINDRSILSTQGTINLRNQTFALTYQLISPNIICKTKALGRDFYLTGEANGTMRFINFKGEGKIFGSKTKQSLASFNLINGTLDKVNKVAKSQYRFQVEKLSQLTHQKYFGNLEIFGNLLYHKGLSVTGATEDLGGFTHFTYYKDHVRLSLHHTQAEKINKLLHYPNLIKAKVTGKINHNLLDETSTLTLGLQDIYFPYSNLTQNLQHNTNIDLEKSYFKNGSIDASTTPKTIYFNFKVQNPKSYIYLLNSHIDQQTSHIKSHFDLYLQNKKLRGKLYGELNAPIIKLDFGALLVFQFKRMMHPASAFDMKSKFDCFKGLADGFLKSFF